MITNLMTVNDYVKIVKKRKWSFIIPALSCFVISVIVALVLPPIYRSTSTILIEEQEIPRELVMATVTSYAEQRLQAINQRVMSTTKLLEIINRFNLYPEERKKWTTEEVVGKMRKDIDFKTISADVVDRRTGRPTSATLAFTISYDGKHPEQVLMVANVLSSFYLEENLKTREKQTAGASKFLGEEAGMVQEQLAKHDSKIASYKEKHMNSLPELLPINLQTMDRVDREIDQLKDQLRTLREKEGYLQSQLASIPTDATNQDKNLLRELKAKLADLTSRASDKHPDVIKTRATIEKLEERLSMSSKGNPGDTQRMPPTAADQADNPAYVTLASQLAGTISDLDSAKRQIEELQKKREAYQARIEASARVEETTKSLIVERNNAQVKYDDLIKKTMEAKVAQGLEKEQMGERFTIIDPAQIPEKPVKPKIPVIILIGMFLGIGSGVGTLSIREHMDHSVGSEKELSEIIPIPVLASIPDIITKSDMVQQKRRKKMMMISTVAVAVVAILIFHFLIMDLDVFWARLTRKM
jgi:polysaccharide chain length determinant protein (PEP-CTERM system associated)